MIRIGRIACLTLLLGGCATDEFVIYGESDGCSSSGGHEAEEVEENDAPAVSKSAAAEMSSRPAPRARFEHPRPDPRPDSSPGTTPAQERRP